MPLDLPTIKHITNQPNTTQKNSDTQKQNSKELMIPTVKNHKRKMKN